MNELPNQYSEIYCTIMNLVDARVHDEFTCRWQAPYGFVPEAGCPLHDA